jgi:protein-S-isoprenylcysteine O-methyltransferase Ste14
MMQKVEDVIGRTLLAAILLLLLAVQGGSITETWRGAMDWSYVISISGKIATFLFTGLCVALTILRLPPTKTAAGVGPRVAAIAGTFLLTGIAILPRQSTNEAVLAGGAALVLLGNLLSVITLVWLGRAFSIVAAARGLVVSGPYSMVRHPLYVSEVIAGFGILLLKGSAIAAVAWLIWVALQFRRVLYEEALLRATFPEYLSYERRVPRFFPWALMPGRRVRESAQ